MDLHVRLRLRKGQDKIIVTRSSSSLQQLKKQIEEEVCIPVEYQALTFCGEPLLEDVPLGDQLSNNNILYVHITRPAKTRTTRTTTTTKPLQKEQGCQRCSSGVENTKCWPNVHWIEVVFLVLLIVIVPPPYRAWLTVAGVLYYFYGQGCTHDKSSLLAVVSLFNV